MPDRAYEAALEKHKTLQAELDDLLNKAEAVSAQVQQVGDWIAMWREFAGEPEFAETSTTSKTADSPKIVETPPARAGARVFHTSHKTPALKTLVGDAVIEASRETLLKEGQPLVRSRLLTALEKNGYRVSGKDKTRNLGTIMWRAKKVFINIDGLGYWPKDTACPAIGYSPSMSLAEATHAAHETIILKGFDATWQRQ